MSVDILDSRPTGSYCTDMGLMVEELEGGPMAGADKGALHPKGLAGDAASGFESPALRKPKYRREKGFGQWRTF
jgi:hypothetical protein